MLRNRPAALLEGNRAAEALLGFGVRLGSRASDADGAVQLLRGGVAAGDGGRRQRTGAHLLDGNGMDGGRRRRMGWPDGTALRSPDGTEAGGGVSANFPHLCPVPSDGDPAV